MNLTMKWLPVTAMAALLSACGSSSDSDTFDYDADAMISQTVNGVIVAGYEELDNKAQLLIESVNQLKAKHTANTLTDADVKAAQDAWKAAREPWEQGESHIFGPVDSLEIDPHLDSWPLNTNDLQAEVDTAQAGYDVEDVLSANDEIQGFHAMEYILFGNGVSDNEKAATEFSIGEINYLIALAQAFEKYTDDLFTAWNSNHNLDDPQSLAFKTFLLAADNEIYSSQLAIIEELIDGMIGIVDEVGNGKIADPFGTSSQTADTSKVESQYSWNSLTDFANNIKGVQNIYRGEFSDSADVEGIIDFVSAADIALSKRVDAEIIAAINAIEAISGEQNMPFREAIKDSAGRARIQLAIDALFTLQLSLTDDLKPLLNDWNAK